MASSCTRIFLLRLSFLICVDTLYEGPQHTDAPSFAENGRTIPQQGTVSLHGDEALIAVTWLMTAGGYSATKVSWKKQLTRRQNTFVKAPF